MAVDAQDWHSLEEIPLEELRNVHKAAKARRLKASLKAIDAGVPASIVCPGDSLLSHRWVQHSLSLVSLAV